MQNYRFEQYQKCQKNLRLPDGKSELPALLASSAYLTHNAASRPPPEEAIAYVPKTWRPEAFVTSDRLLGIRQEGEPIFPSGRRLQ